MSITLQYLALVRESQLNIPLYPSMPQENILMCRQKRLDWKFFGTSFVPNQLASEHPT